MRLLPLLAITLLATGCSTLIHGRYQTLDVTSDPAGAPARLECRNGSAQAVTTPAKLRVRRNAQDCRVVVGGGAFDEQAVELHRKITPAFWGNVAFGVASGAAAGTGSAYGELNCDNPDGCGHDSNSVSLVGLAIGTALPMLVDRATGAMWGWEPARVHVTLKHR